MVSVTVRPCWPATWKFALKVYVPVAEAGSVTRTLDGDGENVWVEPAKEVGVMLAPPSSVPSAIFTCPPAYGVAVLDALSACTVTAAVVPAVKTAGPVTWNDAASPTTTFTVGLLVVVKIPPPMPSMPNTTGPAVAGVVNMIDAVTDWPGRAADWLSGSVP